MFKIQMKTIKKILFKLHSSYMMKNAFYAFPSMKINNVKRINWSGYDL